MIYHNSTHNYWKHDNAVLASCVPALHLANVNPPTQQSWLADSLKQQCDSRLDFIIGVNENRCAAKPMYGREVLDFLTFLPGPRPSPAALSSKGEWGRSGHSSALFAQWQDKYDYWFQSRAVRKAIHSMDDRLELLNEMIDR